MPWKEKKYVESSEKSLIWQNILQVGKGGSSSESLYSKVSIIRPDCSRLLDFEKKIVLVV